MKIIIEGSQKEIAALVSEIQERQYKITEQGEEIDHLTKETLEQQLCMLQERAAVMHKWKPLS